MKKIALLAAFILLCSTSAFAASAASAALSWGGSAVYGGVASVTATFPLIGKTSSNVGFGWKVDPAGYAIATQHKSGTKAFGTSFDATSIYQSTVTTVGTAVTVTLTTGSDSFPVATWTTM